MIVTPNGRHCVMEVPSLTSREDDAPRYSAITHPDDHAPSVAQWAGARQAMDGADLRRAGSQSSCSAHARGWPASAST